MDQEVPPALELDNQILAATPQPSDSLSLELARDDLGRLGSREPRIDDLDALEPPTHEARLQMPANRLDLR
jgi:hypothetical protein